MVIISIALSLKTAKLCWKPRSRVIWPRSKASAAMDEVLPHASSSGCERSERYLLTRAEPMDLPGLIAESLLRTSSEAISEAARNENICFWKPRDEHQSDDVLG